MTNKKGHYIYTPPATHEEPTHQLSQVEQTILDCFKHKPLSSESIALIHYKTGMSAEEITPILDDLTKYGYLRYDIIDGHDLWVALHLHAPEELNPSTYIVPVDYKCSNWKQSPQQPANVR